MDTASFMELSRSSDNEFVLPVLPRSIGGGRGGLFGGTGLAAGVSAMEQATGRAPVWASAQFVSVTGRDTHVTLTVQQPMVGRKVTQARATGMCDGNEILTVQAALGARTERFTGLWETMPECPPPEECQVVERMFDNETIHTHTDTRMGRGMFGFTGTGTPSGDNRSLVWVCLLEVHLDAAGLALVADYTTSSVGNAVQSLVMCTSLDNTIRYANPIQHTAPRSWLLCDNTVDFVGNGFATVRSNMWSQDGTLLAMASQTVTVAHQD